MDEQIVGRMDYSFIPDDDVEIAHLGTQILQQKMAANAFDEVSHQMGADPEIAHPLRDGMKRKPRQFGPLPREEVIAERTQA